MSFFFPLLDVFWYFFCLVNLVELWLSPTLVPKRNSWIEIDFDFPLHFGLKGFRLVTTTTITIQKINIDFGKEND